MKPPTLHRVHGEQMRLQLRLVRALLQATKRQETSAFTHSTGAPLPDAPETSSSLSYPDGSSTLQGHEVERILPKQFSQSHKGRTEKNQVFLAQG